MSHQENLKKVKALDQKVRGLYTMAAGLVNDSSETMCGYGKVISALDIRQQVILRKSGPFVKPTSSQGSKLKPGAQPVPSCAVSSALAAKKKVRSRGKGRNALGLSAHPAPPPASSNLPPCQAPAHPEAKFQSTDIQVKQG